MQEQLAEIAKNARSEINAAQTEEDLKKAQVRYLGKKGEITTVLRGMGKLSPEERPVIGSLANQIRDEITTLLKEREENLRQEARKRQMEADRVDVTLPGRPVAQGFLHPLTQVIEEICDIFLGMGFSIAEGPEVGIHVIAQADSVSSLNRVVANPQLDQFDIRVVTQVSRDDSQRVIDNPEASQLGANRAIVFQDDRNRRTRIKPYGIRVRSPVSVKTVLQFTRCQKAAIVAAVFDGIV